MCISFHHVFALVQVAYEGEKVFHSTQTRIWNHIIKSRDPALTRSYTAPLFASCVRTMCNITDAPAEKLSGIIKSCRISFTLRQNDGR